jgi:hypothetical protein
MYKVFNLPELVLQFTVFVVDIIAIFGFSVARNCYHSTTVYLWGILPVI